MENQILENDTAHIAEQTAQDQGTELVAEPLCNQPEASSASELFERDIEAFNKSYPNISRKMLEDDKFFLAFIEGKSDSTLPKLYSKYEAFIKEIEENAIKREQARQSNAKSAVGALKGDSDTNDGFFTKEQVLKMSPQEIKQNYTKIRQSQANW